MNLSHLLILLSIFSSLTTLAKKPTLIAQTESAACREWVDSVYNSLSERDRVAQLIFPKAPAEGPHCDAAIEKYIGKYHFGGILFAHGTVDSYADLINKLQAVSPVPVLVTLDGEWGLSMRMPDAPRFPKNMGLGAISDPRLLYDYGREVARECRELGIQANFAPVLDLNSNPANPVIGHRSFGEDPARVSALATAYALGLEDGGVQAVAKHFPGHGDTTIDSHKALATVDHSEATLRCVDLVPFVDYINHGLSSVMVGHIAVPSIDPAGGPASLSKVVTTDWLRGKLGFKGLIYTDALGMRGADVATGNNCVDALLAGADVLLCPNNPITDLDAVMHAIADGKVSKSIIEDRCKRVLAYKYVLGLADLKPIETEGLVARINSPEADLVNRRLAAASMTVLFNSDNTLPIGNLEKESVAIVNIGAPADNVFADYCSKYAKVTVFSVGSEQWLSSATLAKLKDFDTVVAAVYENDAHSRNVVAQLSGMRSLIGVFMINAYQMARFASSFSSMKALLLAYDDTDYTQMYAAQAIFGGIKVDGRLPVNLPGVFPIGTGVTIDKSRLGYAVPAMKGMRPELTDTIDSIMLDALAQGAFPGAQVIVARRGDIVFDRNYGAITNGGAPVTPTTVFDCASVSKAVGTLPGIMKAYDLGMFDLDDFASKYIPGLRVEGKDSITVRMLLHHETGMPAALNVYNLMFDENSYDGPLLSSKPDRNHHKLLYRGLYGHDKAKLRKDLVSDRQSAEFPIPAADGLFLPSAAFDTIMARIYAQPISPARKFRYSCLNFCLLMDLEQHVTGQPHQTFVTDSVWAPLGAYGFCYRPLEHHPADKIVYTENDTYLRRQHVHGYVHDETAAFSGGVQGNAGVFGSATDVAKLCQMWLNGGVYGDKRILSPETNLLFTTEKSSTCRRGLGFDKPDTENPDNSPTCDEANPSVYGHTGFTGTCFWVDPDEEVIFIFMSNRVDPTRVNDAFSRTAVRPELFRQIYKSLE